MWPKQTEKVLNLLSKEEKLKGFIFVGGSALSFYLNHRLSEDIDLFSTEKQLKQGTLENVMISLRNKGHRVSSLVTEDMTIQRDYVIDGVKTTFLTWSLESLKKESKPFIGVIKIANLDLIMGMKAYVFGRRNEIRDAYDLYVLFKEAGITKVIDSADRYFDELFSKRLFINQLCDLSHIKESKIEDMLQPKYLISKSEMQNYFMQQTKEYLIYNLEKSFNKSVQEPDDPFTKDLNGRINKNKPER